MTSTGNSYHAAVELLFKSILLFMVLMTHVQAPAQSEPGECDKASLRILMRETARADLIVVGRIVSRRSYESGDSSKCSISPDLQGMMMTEFHVEIEEVLKGTESNAEIVVQAPGGRITTAEGKIKFSRLSILNIAIYGVGDHILWYLVPGRSTGCYYHILEHIKLENGVVVDGQTMHFDSALESDVNTEESVKWLVTSLVACSDYRSLALQSDAIVMGTVESIDEKTLSDRVGLAVIISVEHILRGQVGQKVVVFMSRFENDNVVKGSSMIFFLRKSAEGYEPVAQIAGQYTVSADGATATRPGVTVSVEDIMTAARTER